MDDRGDRLSTLEAPESYRRLKPGPGKAPDDVHADQRDRIHRAMAQLVAESGYRRVTVRRLTRLARVSPGAFYVQFDGKEECFVETCAWIMAQARSRIAASRATDAEREQQLAAALRRLLEGFAADSHATAMALVAAYGGGPAALRQIEESEASIAAILRECLGRRGAGMPMASARWIAAGTMHLARSWTSEGTARRLVGLTEPLVDWASAYLHLEQEVVGVAQVAVESGASSGGALEPRRVESSDRELILAATLRLARTDDYWRLTSTRIREAAGLSAPRFNHEFCDVETCYLAALESLERTYLGPVIAEARAPVLNWTTSVHRSVEGLCQSIVADPDLARLFFVEILTPGLDGMHCRDRMITALAEAFRALVPGSSRPSQLAFEATVAAFWSMIGDEINAGRSAAVLSDAPTFTVLILAPIVGAHDAAVAVGA